MPVKLDPNSKPIVSSEEIQPSSKSNLKQLIDVINDGSLRHNLSPELYCQRSWKLQINRSHSIPQEVFMETCMKECSFYQAYCRCLNRE
jgi:hypothetical protein